MTNVSLPSSATPPVPTSSTLYRRLWRWHFYAGLLVMPFVVLLALSGTVFLFKPQVDRWEERAFISLPGPASASPAEQVSAALTAFPGAHFHSYRVPQQATDAALVHLALHDGGMRDVFVSPQGEVLGSMNSGTRIIEVARRIHGQLLMGQRGSWVVELVACWAIVMILTGLILWWPRGRGVAGVLWPRRGSMLRDLHAVTGFWVSAFALVLLLTGLPWTDVWGNAFQRVRAEMGWVKGAASWSTDGNPDPMPHASHAHGDMHAAPAPGAINLTRLNEAVARSHQESVAFPAVVLAPGAVLFGPPSSDWTLTSLAQDRTRGLTLTFDPHTGRELSREAFADRHPIDRVVGYGLSWHEGALFGVLNQIVGVITALALVTMGTTAFLMWRRRRPVDRLGAPPLPADRRRPVYISVVIVLLAALLPLLAASLLLLWLFDRLLPRISPAAATWLGLQRSAR